MTFRWTQRLMAQVAAEERLDLGLSVMDPLDPYELADRHGIPVYPISQLACSGCPDETIEHFLERRAKAWSAALVPVGTARIIIENDGHETPRRRSSVAHEMSHHLLEHVFGATLAVADHSKAYSTKVEKEALFLSGELLIPDEAARKLAFRDADNNSVATQFGVSLQFAQMRMSGPRVMVQRARAKQRRTT